MSRYEDEIIQGDCVQVLEGMVQDEVKVDLVVTSPPYNTSRTGDYYLSDKAIQQHEGRYDIYIEDKSDDEYVEWTLRIFNLLDKVLSKDGVVLYNISYSNDKPSLMWRLMGELVKSSPFEIVDTIYWKKKSALPNNISHNRLTRIVEPVFVLCRKGEEKTYKTNKKVVSQRDTGQNMYENVFNYIEAKNNDGSNDLNKATYSSDLIYKLLDIYALPKSVVFDPFIGTGTTAIGCLKHNRVGTKELKYIGVELSPNQVKYARDRIETFRKDKQGLWGSL